ncbi:hypothetical protein DM01DRAFT_1410149 [Hesseltinella vesiculosa]|uniref:Uncharacterized protein n=1 Tax=Hesseltinella vesiculosa TaxID=101127 RepID=A0A1X2G8P7_9FUNG|nr:hypothetical protein DM01DRAFT_1410149 [Hesseltinella vesiculosa]
MPLWTVVVIVVGIAILFIGLLLVFLRRNQRHRMTSSYLDPESTMNLEENKAFHAIHTHEANHEKHSSSQPCTPTTTTCTTNPSSGITLMENISSEKLCPDSSISSSPVKCYKEFDINLPLPPPTTSFFSDKLELNSDEATRLFHMYLQKEGINSQEVSSRPVSTNLKDTLAQFHQKATATLRSTLRRQKSSSARPSPVNIQQIFEPTQASASSVKTMSLVAQPKENGSVIPENGKHDSDDLFKTSPPPTLSPKDYPACTQPDGDSFQPHDKHVTMSAPPILLTPPEDDDDQTLTMSPTQDSPPLDSPTTKLSGMLTEDGGIKSTFIYQQSDNELMIKEVAANEALNPASLGQTPLSTGSIIMQTSPPPSSILSSCTGLPFSSAGSPSTTTNQLAEAPSSIVNTAGSDIQDTSQLWETDENCSPHDIFYANSNETTTPEGSMSPPQAPRKSIASNSPLSSRRSSVDQGIQVNATQQAYATHVDSVRRVLQATWNSKRISENGSVSSRSTMSHKSPPGSINPRQLNQHLASMVLQQQQAYSSHPTLPTIFSSREHQEELLGPAPTVSFSSSTVRTMIPDNEAVPEASTVQKTTTTPVSATVPLLRSNNPSSTVVQLKSTPVKKDYSKKAGTMRAGRQNRASVPWQPNEKTPAQRERDRYLQSLKANPS